MHRCTSVKFSVSASISSCWTLVKSYNSRFTSTWSLRSPMIRCCCTHKRSEFFIDSLNARSKICLNSSKKKWRESKRIRKFLKICEFWNKSSKKNRKSKKRSIPVLLLSLRINRFVVKQRKSLSWTNNHQNLLLLQHPLNDSNSFLPSLSPFSWILFICVRTASIKNAFHSPPPYFFQTNYIQNMSLKYQCVIIWKIRTYMMDIPTYFCTT